jgi:SAM-dependent methyltransferase
VTEQPLADLLARLERERLDADRRYNDALTAVDRALAPPPPLPAAPRAFDASAGAALAEGWNILPGGHPATDRSLKGRLRGFIWRLVGPPLDAQRRFNAEVAANAGRAAAAHDELAASVAALTAALRQSCETRLRFESLLVQYLQTITAFVDTKDRSFGGSEIRDRLSLLDRRSLTLKRELAALSPGAAREQGLDQPAALDRVEAATYVGFEDRFRGSVPEIRRRVEDYLPILEQSSNVVDIGCGRGELLRALRDRGITARGVDANAAMAELCRSQGLDVEHGDAVRFLERQADGDLGGLSAIQVVEHFDPRYLARFLEIAFQKMRPGAPLVLETINPACWMAFFETYLRDLTHRQPLHPDTLSYLVQASGFSAVDVQFRQPVAECDRLDRVRVAGDSGAALPRNVAQIADAVNALVDKLNARLFSSMDYVVVARR